MQHDHTYVLCNMEEPAIYMDVRSVHNNSSTEKPHHALLITRAPQEAMSGTPGGFSTLTRQTRTCSPSALMSAL